MAFRRSSGVLLHPTSLPGGYGIGDLGPAALDFVDLLAAGKQRLWQVLPLGPTGYGDSPYQCFSAFAGNPLLISPDRLVDDGLLTPDDIVAADIGAGVRRPGNAVDFPAVIAHREALWPRVLERFDASGATPMHERFDRFCLTQANWLNDYALFMAVKSAHGQAPWTSWQPDIARREPDAIARWTDRCAREIRQHQLTQFLFFEHWQRVRDACHARSIQIMGDLPIFVAHDSADVWSRQKLFRLDPDGNPEVVAGVPPDYFSATGQLWGNPHYRWEELARTGYAWWIERFRALLTMVDAIRIDHFRGFDASWEVPAGSPTAINGKWVKGPGAALFEAVRSVLTLEQLPFVAENLGVITPSVEALRRQFDLPGMAILQFAFGTDPQAPDFRPHNYERNLVVYTGTHDNDTTVGWWTGEAGHSTRTDADIREERDYVNRYLALDERPFERDTGKAFDDAQGRPVHWEFIRAVMASVANTAMVPVQDLLGLGSDARMNRPGVASGNWRWRLTPGQLTQDLMGRLGDLAETYERV
ncbi:MAG TPA: 4-alpha-glucanotransferase [Vicinamibacterales bacterium]|nr:4-alpha-glucanotransferase [Vicinamibacterales bacterium]